MGIILTPLVAFGLYLILVSLLAGAGRLLAETGRTTEFKSDPYASGEAPPIYPALLGYQPFFVVALFFAILHLGVLVLATLTPLASGGYSSAAIVYLVGLALSLTLFIVT